MGVFLFYFPKNQLDKLFFYTKISNMNKQDLSIIIPVYNGQDYIAGCLGSVLRQQNSEKYEIIVVNDGSTDNTTNILKRITHKHPNIHIINQKNAGVSVARNNGIKFSHGKYVTFIDCDDMVGLRADTFAPYFSRSIRQPCIGNLEIANAHTVPNKLNNTYFDNKFFVNMLHAAHDTNADVVMGGKITINRDDVYLRKHLYKYSQEYTTFSDDKHIALRQADVRENANFALYRREMLKKHRLCFMNNMNLDEDMLFCMLATLYAEHVATVHDVTYLYNRHSNTLSNITDKSEEKSKYTIATLQRYSIFLNELRKYPQYHEIFTYWFKRFSQEGEKYADNNTITEFPPRTCATQCYEKSCNGCFIAEAMCENLSTKITQYLNQQRR